MNNYGDQVSNSLKIKVCGEVLRANPLFHRDEEVERVHDHEGPWKVTDRSNNLHYIGRKALPKATYPETYAYYKSPPDPKDPTVPAKSTFWKGATSGKYSITDARVGKFYKIVDRQTEVQTQGFRFSAGNQGTGRVRKKGQL